MLSNLFGPKEEWRVEVINEFESLHVGMAGDEYLRPIPAGETGKAVINKKGDVTVTFDNVKDTPYTSALKVYFNKKDPEYNDYKWLEKTKDGNAESKIKKSSIFG